MKDEKAIRGMASLTILDTVKAGVRFASKNLSALADTHKELVDEYDSSSEEVVQHILEVAGSYSVALNSLGTALGTVDVIAALAEHVSLKSITSTKRDTRNMNVASSAYPPWTRPELRPMGERCIRFTGLRHPVVEAEDDASFIPNDVLLQPDGAALVLLTGPNAGGKSTYLRSVGLGVVLAQLGSFVPADSGLVSLCDGLYTRIGAADDETRGLSTFMAEMLEASIIIEGATENSLVIVDELGRGTSTEDGLGLAWAIAERLLLQNRCLSLFATHLHELTRLGDEHANVRNLHVSYLLRDDDLVLLYKIAPGCVPGKCDESFGLNVAHMLKFPSSVIDEAKSIMAADSELDLDEDELRRLVNKGDVVAIRALLA